METSKKNIMELILVGCIVFGFFLASIIIDDKEISDTERRPLEMMPDISLESISSGEFMGNFEKYALDQFPLRDEFRGIKAFSAFNIYGQKDNNGLYISEGIIGKLEYPLKEASVINAGQKIKGIYDRYLAGENVRVYLSLVPDKNYYMAEKGGYPHINYDDMIQMVKSNMDFAEYIDMFDVLGKESYYKTDTHWRQEKLLPAAWHILEKMNMGAEGEEGVNDSIAAIENYDVKQSQIPFYGVYYGQLGLPMAPEELKYITNEMIENFVVYDYETNSHMSVYVEEKLDTADPYEFFLGGSKSLISIDNPMANSEKELVIFRDSFGSSIAPILAQGYRKTTIVDIRYISPAILDKFISFENQDVLFIYSTSVINNSETFK